MKINELFEIKSNSGIIDLINDVDMNAFVEFVAPETEQEKRLATIFESILNVQSIGIHDNFFDSGGHSLTLLRLIAAIQLEFNQELSVKELINNNTISDIVELLKSKQEIKSINVTYSEEELYNPFPLTPIQLSYLLGRDTKFELGGVSTQYYQEFVARVDIICFTEALNKLILRHPMLRAVIEEDGQQHFLKHVPQFDIVIEKLSEKGSNIENHIINKRKQLSHRIFQPNKWPLFDLQAIHIKEDQYYFFFGIDTIIADAQSKMILLKDLTQIYNGKKLLPLSFNFRDYILSLENIRKESRYTNDKAYWMEKLNDFPDAPSLPLLKNGITSPEFNKFTYKLDNNQWQTLQRIAKLQKITPTALLCAIYSLVLASYCKQSRFCLNLTLFNRYPFHKDVEHIIGDFTTLLLLDIQIESFDIIETAKKISKDLLDALEHRLYDGVEFIRDLAYHKNNVNGAIMPVVFTSALYGNENNLNELFTLKTENKYQINQTSQVLLDCIISDMHGGLLLQWNYVKQMFDKELIKEMFDTYISIIQKILVNNFTTSLPSFENKQHIYKSFNNTWEPIPKQTLIGLYESAKIKFADNIAVQHGKDELSYRELDKLACKVANYLCEQGIVKGDRVGIYSYRSINTIVCILGILKTGATYVPIDHKAPEERIRYINANCCCKIIIDKTLVNKIKDREPDTFVSPNIKPSDIAYIIYTSGSTGYPKGVSISHDAASNTIQDINTKFSIIESDRVLGISELTFDLSVYDVFGTLGVGARLVLIDDIRDTENIVNCLMKDEITVWNSVPAIIEMVVNLIEQRKYNFEKKTVTTEILDLPLYWAPSFYWYQKDNTIWIEGLSCPEIANKMFPELYYLAQQGITIKQLTTAFSSLDQEDVSLFITKLINEKVLISTVQTPSHLFASQAKIIKQQSILSESKSKLYEFRDKVIHRNYFTDLEGITTLQSYELPNYIKNRRSYRHFNTNRMSLQTFEEWISVLRRNGQHYNYASAGSLYPIDVYFYIKPYRIEGMEGGYYYYNPSFHTLKLLESTDKQLADFHYHPNNKEIFQTSAFTVFLVYNPKLSMPKYGGMGYYMAIIDTGIITATMSIHGEGLGIGFCSIGDVKFENVRHQFQLEEDVVLLHTIEGGLQKDEERCDSIEIENIISKKINKTKNGKFSLRIIMMSGDWIPVNLPARIHKIFISAKMYSLGGATEAAIWSIYYPIDPYFAYNKSIPYGTPLANQQFYILNPLGQLCAPGVEGEICIGGRGLANEYIADSTKTTTSFIMHPDLGRIYKTGDMGVLNIEGNYIELRGRTDTQVKINGFRIELEEIENVMIRSGLVNRALVIPTREGHSTQLTGYVVSNDRYNLEKLIEFMHGQLPEYMLLTQIIEIDEIPFTANGKVDKKALSLYKKHNAIPYVAPRTMIEEKLVQIWQELLDHQHIGICDNFFELGGHSLHITSLSYAVFNQFGVKIILRKIYDFPTIEKLAAEILRLQKESRNLPK